MLQRNEDEGNVTAKKLSQANAWFMSCHVMDKHYIIAIEAEFFSQGIADILNKVGSMSLSKIGRILASTCT